MHIEHSLAFLLGTSRLYSKTSKKKKKKSNVCHTISDEKGALSRFARQLARPVCPQIDLTRY